LILDLEHRSATQPIGEMLNGIADSVSILDQDWRISYLNRSAEETLRRMKPELNGVVGKNLWEMVPELRGSNLEHEYRLAITENRPRTFELFFAPLDKWLEIRCFPTASGLMVYSRDISSQRYREQLSALRNEVSIALSKKGDLQAILQECAGLLVNHLNAAFARIWLLNPQTNVLELKASAGLYTHLDGPHGKVPVGQFKIGRIAQSKLPHLSNDVPNDPHVSDQAWARREGMVAFAFRPPETRERNPGGPDASLRGDRSVSRSPLQ
jgi:two-component system, NtrC family, sensor kinase